MTRERRRCPRCGRRLILRRDGVFQWKACRASRACGWTVFTNGEDPRDLRGGEPASLTVRA